MARIADIIDAEKKRLETVLRSAYDAGREDAKREILMVLSGEAQYQAPSHEVIAGTEERKRAPKGLPRKLATRVLFDNYVLGGLTPQDICDAAVTDYEKMIAPSSIRGELRNGKEPKDGGAPRYEETSTGWTLTKAFYDKVLARIDANDEDPYR